MTAGVDKSGEESQAVEAADSEDRLRADFHAQTARIAFSELQRYFAGGKLVLVAGELDLVGVAMALAKDDKASFEAWIADGTVGPVTDEQARTWLGADAELWAVVAQPWVLVQEKHAAEH